jgi:hypothetical protein
MLPLPSAAGYKDDMKAIQQWLRQPAVRQALRFLLFALGVHYTVIGGLAIYRLIRREVRIR